MEKLFKIYTIVLIFTINILQLQAEYPYCFRFTWIRLIDKNNIGDITCETIREDLTNIPCRRPLVTTHNDNIPDTWDLWNNYQTNPNAIGCPMMPGETCVKYTYTYNKGVQNITYMCAKVNTTAGCYHQKYISGLDVEVCLCESHLGAMPCNTATTPQLQHKLSLLLITMISITIFYKLFENS